MNTLWKFPRLGRFLPTPFALALLCSSLAAQDPSIDPKIPPPVVVTVVAADPEAAEPNPLTAGAFVNSATFVITRAGALDFEMPVYYQLGGTAENGVDYVKLSGVATLAKGSASIRVPVVPLGDALKEGLESVVLEIVSPVCPAIYPPPLSCYQVGLPAAAKVVIQDFPVVGQNEPPTAEILRPASGQVFTLPSPVEIAVVTKDVDGYAPKVEVYVDQELVGVSELVFIQAPPDGTPLRHVVIWKSPTPGDHMVVAVAHDNRGAAAKSNPVSIRVLKGDSTPVVTLTAPDAEAVEPKTPLPWERIAPNRGYLQFSRTGSTDEDLTVYFALSGTAVNGKDYQELPGQVVIPKGTNSVLLEVFAINDGVIERTEVVEAQILPPPPTPTDPVVQIFPGTPGYRVGIPSAARVSILDNGEGSGLPVVEVVASDDQATEPPTNDPNVKIRIDDGRFTIQRTGSTELPVRVFFKLSGSAVAGIDFAPVERWALIQSGAASVDVSILPLFDRLVEGDESVAIELIHPPQILDPATGEDILVALPPYDVGARSFAKLVIHDSPPVVENRPPKVDITRPGSGAVFTASQTIHVEVQTADADGYVPWVELFDGKTKIGDSRLDFIQAPKPGTLITHQFEWAGGGVGVHELIALAHDDGRATTLTAPPVIVSIRPDPAQTVVNVEAVDASGAEPDPVLPGMGRPTLLDPAVFRITRQGDLTVPIVVYLRFEGTARNGVDYGLVSQRVEIPKDSATVDVRVEPIDDDLVEGEETVVLVLERPVCPLVAKPLPGCYVIGKSGAAKAVILDNDPNGALRPTLTLTAPDALASEGESPWTSPTATFVLQREGPLDGDLVVYLRASGTAKAGADYEAIPEKVVMPSGQRLLRIPLKAIDDSEVEPIETVMLELLPSMPDGAIRPFEWPDYKLGTPHQAVAVILDNDVPPPPCVLLPDGRFHVCLPGVTGEKYRIMSSSNLLDWQDLGPVEAAEGAVHYVNPDKAAGASRFYRLVEEPASAP